MHFSQETTKHLNLWKAALPVFVLMLFAAQAELGRTLRLKDSAVLQFDEATTQDPTPQRLPTAAIKAASGGLTALYVDWTWLRAVTDDALVRLPRTVRTRLFHVFDETTDLDPAFFQAYTIGGNLLAIVRDDVYGARDLLLKGMRFMDDRMAGNESALMNRSWRDSWRIPTLLGYVYLFELEDIPSAEQYFIRAAAHPDSPSYVRNLGNRLNTPEGRFIVAGNILTNLLNGARERKDPPAVIRELEQKLENLSLAKFFFIANQTLDATPLAEAARTTRNKNQFEIRSKAFEQLKRQGLIPERDPRGATIRLAPAPGHADGILSSATERKPIFGF